MANENEVFDAPLVDPDEMEIRPVLQPGTHGLDGTATLQMMEGRKGRKWLPDPSGNGGTWVDDATNPVAHMEILVIDPEVGPIRLFHDESVGSRSASRFPKWAMNLGFPRESLKGSTVGSIAGFLELPKKVVVEVTLNSAGDRNRVKNIMPLE